MGLLLSPLFVPCAAASTAGAGHSDRGGRVTRLGHVSVSYPTVAVLAWEGRAGVGWAVAIRAIPWRARLGRMGWTTARARPPRRRLPERPPAQQDVEDRAKPPNNVHHPPGDLPARAEIGAARNIDLGQHHRNRVQDDGHDDLHQQFHHARSLSLIHHTLPGGHPTGACGARAPGGPRDRPCPRRRGAGAASPPAFTRPARPSRRPHLGG